MYEYIEKMLPSQWRIWWEIKKKMNQIKNEASIKFRENKK